MEEKVIQVTISEITVSVDVSVKSDKKSCIKKNYFGTLVHVLVRLINI